MSRTARPSSRQPVAAWGLALVASLPGFALAQSTAPATAPVPAQAAGTLPAVPLRVLLVGPQGAPTAGAEGVVLRDLPLGMDTEGLETMLQPLVGRTINPQMVEALVMEINRRLRPAGFFVASVPQQDVTTGTVRIEILQGRVRSVQVEGPSDVAERAPSLAALRAGQRVPPEALDADMAWLEKALPGRRASARFRPGAQPGEMDVRVIVTEPPRALLSAGFDNTGSVTTGDRRINLGVQANRLLVPDDQFSYRVSADPDLRHSTAHSVSWTAPLPTRHLLTLSANSSRLKGKLPAPFDLKGASDGASIRYEVPLRLTGAWIDSVSAAFDYKRSNNNLLFSQTPVTDTVTEIGELTIGYQAASQDSFGQTRGQAKATWVPGRLFGAQNDAAFSAARAGATARYTILQLQLDRTTPLPLGTWLSGYTLQWANANLLGSEQLAAGGVSTVRGFREGAAFGDAGWVWRNDWRLPAWRPVEGSDFFLEFGLFADAARARVHQALAGEPSHRKLASVGLALQAGLPTGLSLSLSWGHRLRSDVVSQPRGGDHGHFALNGSWSF